MNTVPQLIDAFGGSSAFSRIIGTRPSTASEMKRRGSIPVRYWVQVLEAAMDRDDMPHVTLEMLARIHKLKRLRKRSHAE